MSKMSKIDQIHLRAVMLYMSKIDQIHLRAVMYVCMYVKDVEDGEKNIQTHFYHTFS